MSFMLQKTEQLQIRLTPREKAAVKQAALRDGMDMSAWVLSRCLAPESAAFQRCIDEIAAQVRAPKHIAWAHCNDFLVSLKADLFEPAVANVALENLDALAQNLIAAMVEERASQLGVPAPDWTMAIRPLAAPWFGSDLKALRLHLLTQSPIPYRRRNLFVDAGVGARV